MVTAFDNYYARNDKSGIYTHAALDLSRVYEVTKTMDNAITKLLKNPEFSPLIMSACKASPRFCMWPMYTDLVAFFKKIEDQLVSRDISPEIVDLHNAFQYFYNEAQVLVVARCGGDTTKGLAHGFAIYSVSLMNHIIKLFLPKKRNGSICSLFPLINSRRLL